MSSTLSILLTILGIAVVVFAFCADAIRCRFRRRRRCPKCWYDMSHSPGLTCSECGYSASSEKRLRRFRTRRRYALLAPLILAGAWTSHRWPTLQERGWPAAIPSTALVSSVWYLEIPLDWDVIYDLPCCGRPTAGGVPTDPVPLHQYIATICRHELEHRVEDEALSGWHGRLLAEQLLEVLEDFDPFVTSDSEMRLWHDAASLLDKESVEPFLSHEQVQRGLQLWPVQIRCRPQWPAGVDVYAEVRAWRPFGKSDARLEFDVGSPEALPLSLNYNYDMELVIWCESPRSERQWSDRTDCVASGLPVGAHLTHRVTVTRYLDDERAETILPIVGWSRTLEWPIEFVESIDDVLTPVRSEALDQALRESMTAELTPDTDYPPDDLPDLLVEAQSFGSILLAHGSPCLAATFAIMSDGVEIAKGSAWWHVWDQSSDIMVLLDPIGLSCTIHLEYAEGADVQQLRRSQLTLRITSNPELALRCFEADRYWQGEIEIPLHFTDSSKDEDDLASSLNDQPG